MNENGQRLLEFCTINDLAITTNTFFALKDQHKVSWCHPRSKYWHQIDFVLARRIDLNCVRVTRSFYSADCDTDHCKLSVKVKPKHHSKPAPKRKINVNICKHYSKKEAFKNENKQKPPKPDQSPTEFCCYEDYATGYSCKLWNFRKWASGCPIKEEYQSGTTRQQYQFQPKADHHQRTRDAKGTMG